MKVGAQRLKEIQERVKVASRGPWKDTGPDAEGNFYVRDAGSADVALLMVPASRLRFRTPQDAADARFVANAREDVPDLATDLEEVRELVADALQAIKDMQARGTNTVMAVKALTRAKALGYDR